MRRLRRPASRPRASLPSGRSRRIGGETTEKRRRRETPRYPWGAAASGPPRASASGARHATHGRNAGRTSSASMERDGAAPSRTAHRSGSQVHAIRLIGVDRAAADRACSPLLLADTGAPAAAHQCLHRRYPEPADVKHETPQMQHYCRYLRARRRATRGVLRDRGGLDLNRGDWRRRAGVPWVSHCSCRQQGRR